MKRSYSFWITLTTSITIGILAILAQASWNNTLSQRVAEEKAKAPMTNKLSQEKSDARNQRKSQKRIDQALNTLAEINLDSVKVVDKDQKYKEAFPTFLRSIEDLSVEELIAVADKTSDSQLKKWLIMLAAEQSPLRIFKNEELKGRLSFLQIAEALADVDPIAALQALPPLKPRDPDESSIYPLWEPQLNARIRVATKLLGSNLDLGIQTYREIKKNLNGRDIPMGKWGSLGIPSLPKGSIPSVIEAMSDPDYADIRPDLLRLTLTHLMFDGGVQAVIDHADSMQLNSKELAGTIGRVGKLGGLTSEPEPFLEWVSTVRPEEVPTTIVKWAKKDLTAATAWLNQQPPSPMLDKAIAGFASEASKEDSEGAAAWANEIGNPSLRENVLRKIGKTRQR